MNTYVYDVESYQNLFCVTYIPFDIDQRIVDAYVACDVARMEAECKGLDTAAIIADKQKIVQAMGVKQFTIYDSKKGNHINQLYAITDFHLQEKVLYGYNSFNYDAPVMNYILFNAKKYNMSSKAMCKDKDNQRFCDKVHRYGQDAINFGTGFERTQDWLRFYKRRFKDKDLMKILYLDKTFTGLKAMAITLQWYRIQNLPYPVNKIIEDDEVNEILDYNLNDVLITLTLSRRVKKELELRNSLTKEFDIDLTNQSRSSIGKAIFVKYYELLSGKSRREWIDLRTYRHKIKMSEIISNEITFKSNNFQALHKSLYNEVIDVDKGDKFGKTIIINDKGYQMAKGGLHSIDMPMEFDNSDGYLYVDGDVVSFYPNGILKFAVSPEHLSKGAFLATVLHILESRIKAKKDGDVVKADGLKIAVNRLYGGLGDPLDPVYDPKCTYMVTINLQLCLMMLIEALELKGFDVISANTDGIVTRLLPERYEEYLAICHKWEDLLHFSLEYTEYERYVRKDVNNYIAIKKGFRDAIKEEGADIKKLEGKYIKSKGSFIEALDFEHTQTFSGNFSNSVVAKAIKAYYIYGTPIRDFIVGHDKRGNRNIFDFCISQRIDKKFTCVLTKIINGELKDTEIQQYNRFYVTDKNNREGSYIYKITPKKRISLLAKEAVILFNNYFKSDNYGINYGFYVRLAEQVLYGTQGKRRGFKRRTAGIEGNKNLLFSSDDFEKNLTVNDVDFHIEDYYEETEEFPEVVPYEWNDDDIPF